MKVIFMEVVIKRLADLHHMPGNTRLHSEKQIREYIRSIEMFGQLRPMVIDENNIVLAGNGLLEALRKMGKTEAACHVITGLTENGKKKLMLADNRVAALGEEDRFAFEETLLSLSGDIDIPGYGADILKNLTSDLKSIEALTAEKNQPDEKRHRTREKFCTCPQCGFTFKLERQQCRENQSDPVDTEDARA